MEQLKKSEKNEKRRKMKNMRNRDKFKKTEQGSFINYRNHKTSINTKKKNGKSKVEFFRKKSTKAQK